MFGKRASSVVRSILFAGLVTEMADPRGESHMTLS